MFTQKISPTKISPKIFTQKNFHPKNFTQKKCSLKKCSPNKFSPKKIFTQKSFCTTNFFIESVRLSFVDLRWAQLYVSLVWVAFYSAIWQDNLIMFRRQQKYSLANPSIDGGQTVMDVYMHGIAPSWWCMRGCVGGGGRYISDTPDNREIFGKNIALWWPGWSHLDLYSYLRWFGGWREYQVL